MRILFIGDVVGRSGRAILLERLGALVRDWKLDFVAVNGENAAGGFGITEAIYQEFVDAGADVVTGGNHAWDQKEALVFIERAPRLIRPINYPAGTPGRGAALIDAKTGGRVLGVNAMGRIFMDPLDDPFAAGGAPRLIRRPRLPRAPARSVPTHLGRGPGARGGRARADRGAAGGPPDPPAPGRGGAGGATLRGATVVGAVCLVGVGAPSFAAAGGRGVVGGAARRK